MNQTENLVKREVNDTDIDLQGQTMVSTAIDNSHVDMNNNTGDANSENNVLTNTSENDESKLSSSVGTVQVTPTLSAASIPMTTSNLADATITTTTTAINNAPSNQNEMNGTIQNTSTVATNANQYVIAENVTNAVPPVPPPTPINEATPNDSNQNIPTPLVMPPSIGINNSSSVSASSTSLHTMAPQSISIQSTTTASSSNNDVSTILNQDAINAAVAAALNANPETDEKKREQLKSMYLAGFKAAAQAQHQQALRENFTAAQAQLQPNVDGHQNLNISNALHNNPEQIGGPITRTPSSLLNVSNHSHHLNLSNHTHHLNLSNHSNSGVRAILSPHPAVPSSTTMMKPVASPLHQSSSASNDNSPLSTSIHQSPSISSLQLNTPNTSASKGSGTGHSNPFPKKLMDMLTKEDPSIVCFLPKGDAFTVRDPEKFISDILPRYFRHTKVSFSERFVLNYIFRQLLVS